MTTETRFALSDMAIPPGEILDEEIQARGMTQKELAARMSQRPRTINEIISGEKAIDRETAIELENALGIGAHYWIGLETDYRAALARNREREISA